MSVKVIYKDVSPEAKADSMTVAQDRQPFVDMMDLKLDTQPPNIGTCELNLMGEAQTQQGFSNNVSNLKYWSSQMSQADENATFSVPVLMERIYSGNHSSLGITIIFDIYNNDYCTDLNIKWYRDDALLAAEDFEPDTSTYFCKCTVELYNKIVITFKAMSKPYRYLKVYGIEDGVIRNIGANELEKVSISEEVSLIGSKLSINTANIKFRSSLNSDYMFQKKQIFEVYSGSSLIGVFYLDSAKGDIYKGYTVQGVDYIGLIDKSNYNGGIYNNVPLSTVMADILGDVIPYEIAPSLQNAVINGYLPITTKRKAIQQICTAVSMICDTSRYDAVRFYKLQDAPTVRIDDSNTYIGVEHLQGDALYTGVALTQHSYTLSETMTKLYNQKLTGETIIKFSRPYGGLTISGGVIVASNANYAKLSGTGGLVTLHGYEYSDTQTELTRMNPDVAARTEENIASLTDATLVTEGNANAVLDNIYSYYMKTNKVKAKIILNNNYVGQKISLKSETGQEFVGRIVALDYKIDVNNQLQKLQAGYYYLSDIYSGEV